MPFFSLSINLPKYKYFHVWSMNRSVWSEKFPRAKGDIFKFLLLSKTPKNLYSGEAGFDQLIDKIDGGLPPTKSTECERKINNFTDRTLNPDYSFHENINLANPNLKRDWVLRDTAVRCNASHEWDTYFLLKTAERHHLTDRKRAPSVVSCLSPHHE